MLGAALLLISLTLLNFANGCQVATYQKADGSTQWLDSFLVRQNGYLRTPKQGVWLSWGLEL
jgi:hypothetical protein